jgi:hypothetical protein
MCGCGSGCVWVRCMPRFACMLACRRVFFCRLGMLAFVFFPSFSLPLAFEEFTLTTCYIWRSSGRRLRLLLGLFKTPRSCLCRLNATCSSLLHPVFLACSCTERVASSYTWPIHFLGSILTSLYLKTTTATLSFIYLTMKMTTATVMHLLLLSFCIAVALCTYGEDLTRLQLKFHDCQSLSHL